MKTGGKVLAVDRLPYGFRHHPFVDTVDPDVFYRSTIHESACAELFAAIKRHGGLLVLTGEPGTGKTIVLRRVARDIERAGGRVLWCSDAAPLHETSVSLGEPSNAPTPDTRREVLLQALQARVRQTGATMVAVDEAQRLEPTELEALRDLAQAGVASPASGTPLAVLLVGQPGLGASLARLGRATAGRAFDLRVALSPLDASEVAAYVAYRLDQAGARLPDVFDGEAIERVADYTDGIPRVINQLCDASLRASSTAGLAAVSAVRVDTSARRLGLLPADELTVGGTRRAGSRRVELPVMRPVGSRRGRVLAWSASVGVGAFVLLAALYYARQEAQFPPSPRLVLTPTPITAPERAPGQPKAAAPAIAAPVVNLPVVVELQESVEQPPRDPEVRTVAASPGPVAVLVERAESVERPPPRDPEVPAAAASPGPVAVLVERAESVERPPPRDPEVPAVTAPVGPVAVLVLVERAESVERPPPRDPEVPAVTAPAGPVAVLVERAESVERPPPRDPEVPAVAAPVGPVAVLVERAESVERPPPRDPEVPAVAAPVGPVAVLVERAESVERPPPRDPEVPAVAAPVGPVAVLVERAESVERPPPRDPEVPAVGRVAMPSQVIPEGPLAPVPGTASQRGRALLDAAESGSTAQARALLAAGTLPNTRDGTGMTPLMVAVIHGHGEVAGLLLDAGADVNARDGSGATALMLAANNDRAGLLQTLLDRRADVNARTRAGWTALTYAAWKGHPVAARRLLAAGADSALTDRQGWTPLQYATWRAADVTRAGTPDAADPSSKDDPASAAAAHLRFVEVIGLLGKTSAQRTR